VQSTYKCNSSSDTTVFTSQVVPYLYQVEIRIVVTIEDYGVDLHCHLLVGTEGNQNTTWEWRKGSTVIVSGERPTVVSNNTQSVLTFAKSTTLDSAMYQCTAINSFGTYSRNIELRVKSKFFVCLLWRCCIGLLF